MSIADRRPAPGGPVLPPPAGILPAGRDDEQTIGKISLVPLIFLLSWRITVVPPESLWSDAATLLSGYSILAILLPQGRTREVVTFWVMLQLMAAYLGSQIPMALDMLRQAW